MLPHKERQCAAEINYCVRTLVQFAYSVRAVFSSRPRPLALFALLPRSRRNFDGFWMVPCTGDLERTCVMEFHHIFSEISARIEINRCSLDVTGSIEYTVASKPPY